MENQTQYKDNRMQDFQDWFNIKESNGWLIYKRELEELMDRYTGYMDNPEAGGELLKSYQLIKKGLKVALDIPKILENKAKLSRKENKNGLV